MSIAEKYAEALLEVGKDKNCLEKIKENFFWLIKRLHDNDQVRLVFVSPLFSGENKKAALDRIVGNIFCAEFTKFLHVVADKKREKHIFDIYEHFMRIADVYQGKVRVQIKTAFPLDSDLAEKLKEELKKRTGKEIVLENMIDKRIIGGAVLKMDDFILDNSVLNGLNMLEKELVA